MLRILGVLFLSVEKALAYRLPLTDTPLLLFFLSVVAVRRKMFMDGAWVFF